MKVAFFHDTPLLRTKNGQLYSNGFKYEIWQRYLDVFDELIVCTRVREISDKASCRYSLSSGNNVEFKLNERYKNPIQVLTQYNKVNIPIQKVINEVDGCIIRLPSVIGLLAVKECIKSRKPYLIELVGCSWDAYWNYGNIKGKILAPFMYRMTKQSVENAKQVMYITNQFLQSRYPTKGVEAICSNLELNESALSVLENRKKKVLNRVGKIVIGTVGNLDVAYKGQQYVIEALPDLISKGYDIEYQIVGGGSKERLERLSKIKKVEKNVIFKGSKSHDEVFKWMDELDIYIQPSDAEAQGRALLEAMSRGCPAICSEVGGMVELIEEKYRFKKSNYKELVKVIESMLSEDLVAISERNFKFCNQNFNKDILKQKRTAIYSQLKDRIKNEKI